MLIKCVTRLNTLNVDTMWRFLRVRRYGNGYLTVGTLDCTILLCVFLLFIQASITR